MFEEHKHAWRCLMSILFVVLVVALVVGIIATAGTLSAQECENR